MTDREQSGIELGLKRGVPLLSAEDTFVYGIAHPHSHITFRYIGGQRLTSGTEIYLQTGAEIYRAVVKRTMRDQKVKYESLHERVSS